MRTLVPIKAAPPYIGCKSVASVYALINRDPEFAKLWFRLQGRTIAFADSLVGYAEARARTEQAFPPAPGPMPKRGRGRPRKVRLGDAATALTR